MFFLVASFLLRIYSYTEVLAGAAGPHSLPEPYILSELILSLLSLDRAMCRTADEVASGGPPPNKMLARFRDGVASSCFTGLSRLLLVLCEASTKNIQTRFERRLVTELSGEERDLAFRT